VTDIVSTSFIAVRNSLSRYDNSRYVSNESAVSAAFLFRENRSHVTNVQTDRSCGLVSLSYAVRPPCYIAQKFSLRSAYPLCFHLLIVQYLFSLRLYFNPVLFTDVYSHFYRAMLRYGNVVRPSVCPSVRNVEVP